MEEKDFWSFDESNKNTNENNNIKELESRRRKKDFPVFKVALISALALSLVTIIILAVTLGNTAAELKILENKHMAVYGKDYKGALTEKGDMVEVFDF